MTETSSAARTSIRPPTAWLSWHDETEIKVRGPISTPWTRKYWTAQYMDESIGPRHHETADFPTLAEAVAWIEERHPERMVHIWRGERSTLEELQAFERSRPPAAEG